jgi:hypothetical protein
MPFLPFLPFSALDEAPPHYHATQAAAPPVIDGRIDDAVWLRADAVSSFTQKFPSDGKSPVDKTTIRVLYDKDAIYVAFDCEQSTPPIRRLTRRDREVESDWVSFAVDSRQDGKSAFEFTMNAAGVLVDALRFDDTSRSTDYDENWQGRVAITPRGWSAELRIPLRILRFTSVHEQSWGMQARRYVSVRQETDEWAFIPRGTAGEVSHYGRLDGLRDLKAGTPVELRPFVLGRVRRRDSSDQQIAHGTDVGGSAGIDLKWHATQALTLDATFNPDFAQVEADQLVLNLSKFETYYPEKRPFFLEGTDMFATPLQLVYTRRIGAQPAVPLLRTGETLVDVPQPTAIYGAIKLVGRLSDRWSVGILQALTARNDVGVQLADTSQVRRMADPLSSFNVLRLKYDLGSNGYIGFLGTGVARAEPTLEYPRDPASAASVLCPNGVSVLHGSRCFNNAFVGGADWRWRSGGGDYVTTGQVVASTLVGGPVRSVVDGTVIRPGDADMGAIATLTKEGGKHWAWDAVGGFAGRKFDYTDVGYERRSNQIAVSGAIEYRTLAPLGPTLETHTTVDALVRNNISGLALERTFEVATSLVLKNFWRVSAAVQYSPSRFDDRETGDGTALERDGYLGDTLSILSDPTRRVSFTFNTQEQFLFDGINLAADAGLMFRVQPQFDVEILPTGSFTTGEPRYAANGALPNGTLPGQYVFGNLTAKSVGAILRATYTFTPELTLQSYAQLFVVSGHYGSLTQFQGSPTGPRPTISLRDLSPYQGSLTTSPDFEQGALNINVVLRWEYRLGSALFLVYSRAQEPNVLLAPGEMANLNLTSVQRAPADDELLLKLSYWL